MTEDRIKGYKWDVEHILAKPFDPEELVASLIIFLLIERILKTIIQLKNEIRNQNHMILTNNRIHKIYNKRNYYLTCCK